MDNLLTITKVIATEVHSGVARIWRCWGTVEIDTSKVIAIGYRLHVVFYIGHTTYFVISHVFKLAISHQYVYN